VDSARSGVLHLEKEGESASHGAETERITDFGVHESSDRGGPREGRPKVVMTCLFHHAQPQRSESQPSRPCNDGC